MKILYLIRAGARARVWIATDRTQHVVGSKSHARLRVMCDWLHRHGWPDAIVVVPGAYRTVTEGLARAAGDGLLALGQVVDLAREGPGKLVMPGRFWESDTPPREGEHDEG